MARRSTGRHRYAAYDGGPDPLAPPVDLAEALDAIGEDVMAGYSPERAMQEFLRRGCSMGPLTQVGGGSGTGVMLCSSGSTSILRRDAR